MPNHKKFEPPTSKYQHPYQPIFGEFTAEVKKKHDILEKGMAVGKTHLHDIDPVKKHSSHKGFTP